MHRGSTHKKTAAVWVQVHVVRSLKARERTTDDLLRERGKKSRLASQDQEGRGVHAYALPKSRERSGDDLLRRSNEKKNSRLPSLVLAGAPQKNRGAPSRRPFQFGRKSKKEAPDTPLRYVTGFNII